MSLVFTAEQEQLRENLRRFCSKYLTPVDVRRTMSQTDGLDSALWQRMAAELGLHGLAVPEEYGGAGFGLIELLVVFEELGRAVAATPFLGSIGLSANALLASGDSTAMAALLPGIVDGSVIAALAVTEDDGAWDRRACTVRADSVDGVHLLTGHKNYVLDGAAANHFLVSAGNAAAPSLYAVRADAPGLRLHVLDTLDLTRKQVRLEFSATPARPIGDAGAAGPVLDRTLDIGLVMIAAELLGIAQSCLEMTVEYAKQRSQFGRRIGSFQAVKHRLADMLVAVESARVAVYHAGSAGTNSPDELPVAAAMAKAVASQAATFCSTQTIQLHGGIGFTWEHDAHLYYRRAQSMALFFGNPAQQHCRLADLLKV
ncbi:acyl-CoA dehydrogenase family protein [Mycobacterium vicinigordonae]|uniref:Acyl-CoA/acyl-ACP dehydrogenase n=1 Tax=Mycobacterium vicinigordonae TaxID=1719132 RepID=A0A7D6DXQ3_9MYCO|nr:acyl-CoA dehydrogenase family protein [Mycobacterium vicinigordonae]QLL07407.1 acyl-CoA/acyl-ACP dehydrogenase [Mycobacterium vicinigordonae]